MSNYNPAILGSIQAKAQSAWGTAETSGFSLVECEPTPMPVAREIFRRDHLRGGLYTLAPLEGSQSGADITLRGMLRGLSASAPVADPTAGIVHAMIGSLMGSGASNGYYLTGQETGSSTTTLKVVTAADPLVDFTEGGAVFVTDGTTRRFGWIDNITDNGASAHDLDMIVNMGITPSSGVTVYGAYVASLTTTDPTFFTIQGRSLQSNSIVTLEGCVPHTLSLTMNPKGVVMYEITLRVHAIAQSSGSALTDDEYTAPILPVAIGANAARFAVGATETNVQSLKLSVSKELAERVGHSDAQGVVGYSASAHSASLEWSQFIDSSTAPITALDTSWSPIVFQAGGTPGRAFGLIVPAPIHVEVGEISEANGLYTQAYKVEPGRYADGSGATTAPAATSLRLAWA